MLFLFNLTCFGHSLAIYISIYLYIYVKQIGCCSDFLQKSRIPEAQFFMNNVDSHTDTIIFQSNPEYLPFFLTIRKSNLEHLLVFKAPRRYNPCVQSKTNGWIFARGEFLFLCLLPTGPTSLAFKLSEILLCLLMVPSCSFTLSNFKSDLLDFNSSSTSHFTKCIF